MFDRKAYNKKYGHTYRAANKEKLSIMNLAYKFENREKIKKQRKKYRKNVMTKIKEQVRANKLKMRYGMTPMDYIVILEKQKGGCAICGNQQDLNVDHCHKSKKVRGILCGNCNRAIGLLKEDLARLENAILYLKNN